MTRRAVAIATCVALAACAKPVPQAAPQQAPQAPQVRIGQAGSTAFVPTVAGEGTVALRKVAAPAPGSPVVAEARSYILKLVVPDTARIALGATAHVTFASFDNDTVVGRVTAIGKGGAVEIALPNDARLKAGQTGAARIAAKGAATPALAVPPSALFARKASSADVYVVDIETARLHLRHVTLGEENEAGIAVTSGMKLGEWVALSRVGTLHDGMKIAPLGPE